MSVRATTRVRGFATWNPSAESFALIGLVKQVLAEYAAYLPLTVRQIFYRLVGAHGYDKTELAYERLGEKLNRARRSGLIDFASIRDDGIVKRVPHHWDDAGELVRTFINSAESFVLDRQRDQLSRLFFVVEAAGMVPMIEEIADPYGITVLSSGGFDSVTAKYGLAQILSELAWAVILHIGDHDPSGVHVFSSIMEDVTAFAKVIGTAQIEFVRLAVTPQQVVDLSLPTAPPKSTDNRSFAGETAQVEAIPPDVLTEIVREAILDRIDHSVYDAVLAQEERIKARFRRTLIPALRRIT